MNPLHKQKLFYEYRLQDIHYTMRREWTSKKLMVLTLSIVIVIILLTK